MNETGLILISFSLGSDVFLTLYGFSMIQFKIAERKDYIHKITIALINDARYLQYM